MNISIWISLLALVVSIVVAIINIFKNRFNLKVICHKNNFALKAYYFSPALDPSNGNVSSFAIELILENRSSCPLCISSINIKANRYGFELPAKLRNKGNDNFVLEKETCEGTEYWDISDYCSFPVLLQPYDAKLITVLFPISSDNYNPCEYEALEEPDVFDLIYIPYTLKVNTTRRNIEICGETSRAKLITCSDEAISEVDTTII